MKTKILAWIFNLGLALLIYAFVIEPGFFHRAQHYSIVLKNWRSQPLKVVVIADLHVGAPFNGLEKLKKIVNIANMENPDLVLLAGDFVIHGVLGGQFVEPEESAKILKHLKAKLGVFAVLGNHDHWHDAGQVTKAFENAGIPVMTNKVRHMDGFWLMGIDDSWAGDPQLDRAMIHVTNQEPILLFTHNPDFFVKIPDRVPLTIAGHTHGGQVYIPLIGRPIVPSDYGERFAIGHIIEGNKHLFVNPGTGTSILPVRFLVPPEISVLTITGTKK